LAKTIVHVGVRAKRGLKNAGEKMVEGCVVMEKGRTREVR